MDTNTPFPAEIRKNIQEFVDQIDQVLIGRGLSRVERNTICDEVETQIFDMLERKTQAGAELNLELLSSVLETIDQPDAYRNSSQDTASSNTSTKNSDRKETEKQPGKPIASGLGSVWSYAQASFEPVRSFYQRHTQKPHIDPLSVVGLVLGASGVILMCGGMAGRMETAIVIGLLFVFLGAVFSGIAYWRIRNAKGKLLGLNIAAIGLLIMPTYFANAAITAILFFTPLAILLGSLFLIATLIYLNYRVLRWAVLRLTTNDPVATEMPDPKRDSPGNGSLVGAIVSDPHSPPAAEGFAGT